LQTICNCREEKRSDGRRQRERKILEEGNGRRHYLKVKLAKK
jgi:hypothetical protein